MHSEKKVRSTKTTKTSTESNRQRSKTTYSSEKSKKVPQKQENDSKKEDLSKTKNKRSMKKSNKKRSGKVSAKTERKDKSTTMHPNHEVTKDPQRSKSRSRSPSVMSSKKSKKAYIMPLLEKQSLKRKSSPSPASTVLTESIASSRGSETSTMQMSLRALDFESTSTSSKKKHNIAEDKPVDEVNFLSEENLEHIICKMNPSLDSDQVKITPYKEKAAMVAKNYRPKALMVPFIKLCTLHNVELKGVNPETVFTYSEN